MIIACLLLICLQQKLWKSIESGQWNDGVIAPNTQQLHHRLGHINRTLHADIEKPTTLEKTFNKLLKIHFYVLIKKN